MLLSAEKVLLLQAPGSLYISKKEGKLYALLKKCLNLKTNLKTRWLLFLGSFFSLRALTCFCFRPIPV